MEENIFYENGDIKVTSSRFIVKDATYPIANVASVKKEMQPPKTGCAIMLIFIGMITVFWSLDSMSMGATIVGITIIFLGIYCKVKAKAEYTIVLTTSGSNIQALTSTDKIFIDKVIKALNDSIVSRG